MALNDHALCTFVSLAPSLLHETLWVQQWQGEERLSQPYRFEVRLATVNALFDDEALLGNRAVLTLSDVLGGAHPYHGVVTQVDYLDADSLYHYYRVVLEPRVVQLRHFRFSEIWLDKSLPELIRDVLKLVDLNVEGPGIEGLSDSAYDFDIRLPLVDEALTQATFTCQFEETSFDFISRLLEHFGVYYFFEQGADGEALVLCGDRRYQPQLSRLLAYRREDSELDVGLLPAVAHTFERKLIRQVAGVTLREFSASNAQLKLEANALVAAASLAVDASTEQRMAVSDSPAYVGEQGLYGEHFGSLELGQWLATRRAQAIGCRQREFHGRGRATGLRAGYPMLLADHPRPAFNTDYQVIEVHHEGYQPLPGLGSKGEGPAQDLSTRFIALPGDVQFRAPNLTPRPYVKGVLSAVVDGDEETGRPLLNDKGCYKVSFPFIRGVKNATRGSAWLRMATLSSGSSHGMNFPLLKGAEVLVSFLGGDPDRPVITGSVPNSENPNVVSIHNATQSGFSTPGGHLFAMEDNPSGTMMRMGASTGCSFTLGDGDVSGAHLRTDKHMQLASSSYQQNVPGIYWQSITGGSAPESAGTSERLMAANFIGAGHKEAEEAGPVEAGDSTDSSHDIEHKERITDIKNTVLAAKVEMTTAAVKLSGTAGMLNGALVTTGTEMSAKFSAVDMSFKFAGATLAADFSLYSKKNSRVIFDVSEKIFTSAEFRNEKTIVSNELYDIDISASTIGCHTSLGSHEISVGRNRVVITKGGILIKSAKGIYIDGPLHVNGNMLVTDELRVGGNAFIDKSLEVDVNVVAKNRVSDSLIKGGVANAKPGSKLVRMWRKVHDNISVIKSDADSGKDYAETLADNLAQEGEVVRHKGEGDLTKTLFMH